MHYKRYIYITILLILTPILGFKSTTTDGALELAYIKNFTNLTRWSSKNPIADDFFKIAIITPNPFKKDIKNFVKFNKIKGKPIQCIDITNLSNLPKVNIVFIPNGHDFSIESILTKFKAQSPLIVTARKGYGERGADFNLFNKDNRLRFEINHKAAKNKGYEISSKLLKIAKIVE